MYHKVVKKKSGLLTMLIHENAREVKQILPENSIRMYLRITITLQNHMSTEKFYQYLHKKKIFLRHVWCCLTFCNHLMGYKWFAHLEMKKAYVNGHLVL